MKGKQIKHQEWLCVSASTKGVFIGEFYLFALYTLTGNKV